MEYNDIVNNSVEFTDEFNDWWQTLSESQQEDVAAVVELLMQFGPSLPYPYSSGIKSSRHSHMRELRVQSGGKPIRIFYAFDPRRIAILLIGNTKKSDERFYRRHIPLADKLYDEHLNELNEEGLV